MEPITSQSSITLVVKTPNQRVRDIEVSCLLDWTVEKLKNHLANVYPTKPARSSQKIIYSGKLLDDHFVLKDVLLESEGQHQTVHLVCTPSPSDNIPSSLSKQSVPARDPPASQSTMSEASTSTTATTSQPDGLRHRTHAYPQHTYYNPYHGNLQAFPSAAQMNPGANADHFLPTQPYLHHQFGQHGAHHYAAHHMAQMQWMHHMAQMMQGGLPYMPMHPPIPYPQQPVTQQQQTPQANPPTPAPAAQAAPAPERRENRPQNRNIVMNANAGGGMMQEEDDDEDNNQRDWLDYIYMTVRVLMLMSIFWFYSSAERLILMAVTLFVVWLLQSGWLNLNRAQRNRQQDPQVNLENNREVGRNERDDEDNEDDEDEDGEDEEDAGETDSQTGDTDDPDNNTASDSNTNRQPEHPGYLVVCFNFFTTFFTSLIPQAPRPIAQP